MTPWRAPFVGSSGKELNASITIPGSKSLTNRYLVLAALSGQPVALESPLIARDTQLMAQALQSLGVGVDTRDPQRWIITPSPLRGGTVFAGLAGTVMRFIPPLAALADGDSTIDGDPQARLRPMGAIVDGLRQLGVSIESEHGSLPLRIHGTGHVAGGTVRIDASASSQFVSGLLLAAPRFNGALDVYHEGHPLPSQPHIDMTIDALRLAGVTVASEPNHWRVKPSPMQLPDLVVEPDLSNAAPFLAAAMVCGGSVSIAHWPARTTQPGDHLHTIFERMGAHFTYHRGDGTELDAPLAHGTYTLMIHADGAHTIRALDMDLHDVGELVPTLAAVAAFADGTSYLRNIGQLRGHETDRLHAITTELRKLGVDTETSEDTITIHPAGTHGAGMHGAILESYADHRMATFGAIIGLGVPGVSVKDVATTSKTLPNFVKMWEGMLA